MAIQSVFTKSLATASANNIAASQSGTAGVKLTLNGSATPFLSTTSSAAVVPGGLVIPVASVTGLVVGCVISDSTASTAFVSGTVVTAVGATSVQVWPPVSGVAGVGNGDTIVFNGVAIIDAATSTNLAIGRRVALAYTGTSSFTIVGTNSTGNVITDTLASAASTNQSNLDFVTVSSITPLVTAGVTGLTAGTNGVGSSPWWVPNWYVTSVEDIGFSVELVSGSANYTVQYTYDDVNNLSTGVTFPLAFDHSVVASKAVTADGSILTPVTGVRLLINSGTGVLRFRILQSGIG